MEVAYKSTRDILDFVEQWNVASDKEGNRYFYLPYPLKEQNNALVFCKTELPEEVEWIRPVGNKIIDFYIKSEGYGKLWWEGLSKHILKHTNPLKEPITLLCGERALRALHDTVGAKAKGGFGPVLLNDIDFPNSVIVHYPQFDSTSFSAQKLWGYPLSSYDVIVMSGNNQIFHYRAQMHSDLYD